MKPQRPEAKAVLRRVSTRARARRLDLGLTVKGLAAAAGLSPRFVSQLEAGEANIAIGRLASVARALALPIEQLVAEGRGPGPICVALLGLRGAGKTTLGTQVAASLGLPFLELASEIEAAAGLGLPEIFSLHGEGSYRRMEARCLGEVLDRGLPLVLALGGGVVHNEPAFALARERCTTVWLRADPADHMRRVLDQGDRRPMADRSDAMAELRALLAAREPLYRQAELHIDSSAGSLEQTLALLLRRLAEVGVGPPPP